MNVISLKTDYLLCCLQDCTFLSGFWISGKTAQNGFITSKNLTENGRTEKTSDFQEYKTCMFICRGCIKCSYIARTNIYLYLTDSNNEKHV